MQNSTNKKTNKFMMIISHITLLLYSSYEAYIFIIKLVLIHIYFNTTPC